MSRDEAPNKVYVCYIDDGFERIEIVKAFVDMKKAEDYCNESENLHFEVLEIE